MTSAVTWLTLRGLDPHTRQRLVLSASTNVHNMRRYPVRALITSAFWYDTDDVPWRMIGVFAFVAIPAERLLGTRRWIAVFTLGHVGATLITVSCISWAVSHDLLPGHTAHVVDVGSSYGQAALAAAFTAVLPYERLRPIWAAGLLGLVLLGVARGGTFTDYGHLCAALLGFASIAIGRHRGGHRRRLRFRSTSPAAASGTARPLTGA